MANSDLLHVTNGNSKFAIKFYSLISKEKGNIFFSPISAHAVLAMAYQGAAGSTADSFSTTLSLKDQQVAANGYSSVLDALNSVSNVTLHIANKIFTMQGFALKSKFKNVITDYFKSDAEFVDFAKNVEAANTINEWVEKKTNSKIRNLIAPDCLDGLTRLVLVNAVYFKGNWAEKFNPNATKVEQFYVSPTEKVDCQMMHITKRFRFCESDILQAKILELPYTNRDISMIIILPNSINGIDNLEERLTITDIAAVTKELYTVEVEVSLPKFKIETTMDLKNVLTEMGLGIIFESGQANFSGIADEPLFVSKVIQKAFIEVNEEGAEAAAATGMKMMLGCAPKRKVDKIVFKADHPFIIILQVQDRDVVLELFNGKVENPTCD